MNKSLNIDDLTTDTKINGVDIHIRPINPEDMIREKEFVERLSPESRHFRFLGGVQHLTDKAAKELCEIDFDKRMAFIALIKDASGNEQEIGVSRYATDNDGNCESAVTVADQWQNHGLGRLLMDKLINFAREKGKKNLYSLDFANNTHMHQLANDLGMKRFHDPDDGSLVHYQLAL